MEPAPRRVAESASAYGRAVAAVELARYESAWRRSPHFREPGAGAAEFVAAGAAVLRHPLPAPADARWRLAALATFARGREPPLGALGAAVAASAAALKR